MTRRSILLVTITGLGALSAFLLRTHREAAPGSGPERTGEARPSTTVTATPPSRSRLPPARPVTAVAKSSDVIASRDPTSKAYDPVVLNRAMDLSPLELFDTEPRDPAFAEPRERALRERILERLRSRIDFVPQVDVRCHTSSCELTIESGRAGDNLDEALQAIDLPLLSETTTVGPLRHGADTSRNGISIVILYSVALRDHAAYEQLLRQHEKRDARDPSSR